MRRGRRIRESLSARPGVTGVYHIRKAMNPSHTVKLRSKTLARLRIVADALEMPISAVMRYAIEEAIEECAKSAAVSIPIRFRGKTEDRDPIAAHSPTVKLDADTEARMRNLIAQAPLLKSTTFLRGAVERFVERVHQEEGIRIRLRADAGERKEVPVTREGP